MEVYEYAESEEGYASTGKAPNCTRWIDIDKGDTLKPLYRSGLVAKEFKVDIRPELVAATPPTECLQMLQCKVAEKKSNNILYID